MPLNVFSTNSIVSDESQTSKRSHLLVATELFKSKITRHYDQENLNWPSSRHLLISLLFTNQHSFCHRYVKMCRFSVYWTFYIILSNSKKYPWFIRNFFINAQSTGERKCMLSSLKDLWLLNPLFIIKK